LFPGFTYSHRIVRRRDPPLLRDWEERRPSFLLKSIAITEKRAGKPGAFMPGRDRRSFSGGWGGGVCMLPSLPVAIAIVAMNGPTMAMGDALLSALLRSDIK